VLLQQHYPDAEDHYLYPGTEELLDFLRRQPLRLGLISGNLERGAHIKLQPYRLRDYFSVGVYGSDHPERDQLPPLALAKCRAEFGETFSPEQVIIIGDTIRDVWCAHCNDMRAIAVVRHAERRTGIASEKPDLIVENFADLTPIRNYIESCLH